MSRKWKGKIYILHDAYRNIMKDSYQIERGHAELSYKTGVLNALCSWEGVCGFVEPMLCTTSTAQHVAQRRSLVHNVALYYYIGPQHKSHKPSWRYGQRSQFRLYYKFSLTWSQMIGMLPFQMYPEQNARGGCYFNHDPMSISILAQIMSVTFKSNLKLMLQPFPVRSFRNSVAKRAYYLYTCCQENSLYKFLQAIFGQKSNSRVVDQTKFVSIKTRL